jgi:hypothetical protein
MDKRCVDLEQTKRAETAGKNRTSHTAPVSFNFRTTNLSFSNHVGHRQAASCNAGATIHKIILVEAHAPVLFVSATL